MLLSIGSALEVNFNVMRSIDSRFTYLLTLLTYSMLLSSRLCHIIWNVRKYRTCTRRIQQQTPAPKSKIPAASAVTLSNSGTKAAWNHVTENCLRLTLLTNGTSMHHRQRDTVLAASGKANNRDITL